MLRGCPEASRTLSYGGQRGLEEQQFATHVLDDALGRVERGTWPSQKGCARVKKGWARVKISMGVYQYEKMRESNICICASQNQDVRESK